MSDALAPDAPLTAFERAANGDRSGFLELAAQHFYFALNGHEPPAVAYAQAAVYTRLAAALGGEEEATCLFYVLDQLAEALRTDGWEEAANARLGEAIALAEGLAEQGYEAFGDMVVKSADTVPRRAFELAASFRDNSSDK